MEECSDIKNENLAVSDTSSLNFKSNFDRILIEYDEQHQGSRKKAWTFERISEVINGIKNAKVPMSSRQRRTAMDYYWMNKYDIITTETNEDCLIFKRITETAPAICILPREQYFDVLSDIHESCGHGGRDKMLNDIKTRYYIPKKAVEFFVSLCPICANKRIAPRKDIVGKPIVPCDFSSRGEFDLMDFESCPDGEFKWLLKYQENTTKFLNLRPLKTKSAIEVASELMKIFLTFRAPCVLQSDNGPEFTVNVIKQLLVMWPECQIVHDDPHHSQTQDSIEKSNQDIENMLRSWMKENESTNWSLGCYFVQYYKNASFHQLIGKSPYKALFGNEPKLKSDVFDCATPTLSTIEIEEKPKTFKQELAQATYSYNNDGSHSETVTVKIEKIEPNTCAVCHYNISGALKCEFCNSDNPIKEDYGPKVKSVEHDIKVEKDQEKGIKRPAKNIIDTTVKKRILNTES